MTMQGPFRIGIIGAENSHAAAIAKEINLERSPAGFAVTHIWGETEAFAEKTAEAGAIPTIVRDPAEMLGKVDGVMVDHRDGKYHLAAARPFVEAGLPVFIDKPLSTSLDEARRFLQWRRERRVPVTTMSAIPHQACIRGIRDQLAAIGTVKGVNLNGPGDSNSEYGGLFFYGIHQADLMVALFGVAPESVVASEGNGSFVGVVKYPGGLKVTLGMTGAKTFSVTAVGSAGSFHTPIAMDAHPYAATTALFTGMFRSGIEPFDDDRMLAPIAVLEALRDSAVSGRRVDVARS